MELDFFLKEECKLFHSYPNKPTSVEEIWNETKQRWETWKFYHCKKCSHIKITKSIN